MLKRVKKRFDLNVETNNQVVTKTFELDKTIKNIKGILITSDRDDLIYYRGTQKIEINAQEIFPESYESKLLMTGINVSPHKRYYDLGNVDPGNGQVKVTFVDVGVQEEFEEYRVSLYLSCEMEDEA